MAKIDVIMPQMGESIAEGTLSRWMKKVGDTVKRDEPIFEISTDKVDAEIPAPQAGVLVEILVQEGQTVPIQTVVARLETDASASAPLAAPLPSSPAAPPAAVPAPAAPLPSSPAVPPAAAPLPSRPAAQPAASAAFSCPASGGKPVGDCRGASAPEEHPPRPEDGRRAQSRHHHHLRERPRRPRHEESDVLSYLESPAGGRSPGRSPAGQRPRRPAGRPAPAGPRS